MDIPDAGLTLPPSLIPVLRASVSQVGEQVIAAVVSDVPSYSGAFAGERAQMGETIATAVTLALDGFLERVGAGDGDRPLRGDVRDGAYALGRGEARSGRTTDALLAAYRVGARVAWQGLSRVAVSAGLDAEGLAGFAELTFAYIDELSAYSVAGHNDETDQADRDRQRLRERVARLLLTRAPYDAVEAAARRADWELPETLTVALVPPARARATLTALGSIGGRALGVAEDWSGGPGDDMVVLLVPDAVRITLRRALPRSSVLGPTRPALEAADAYDVALRAHRAGLPYEDVLDTDEHLVSLVLGADAAAYEHLRGRALRPLEAVSPASREKLEATLRAWLLCQGRREDVAQRLFVHPQTVRYRMGQLRELFGDRLTDPDAVLELVVALGPLA